MPTTSKKVLIAEVLLEKKLITKEQLDAALLKQKNSNKRIGQILVELGYITEDKFLNVLGEQLGLPFVNLNNYATNPKLVRLLPEFYARHFRSIVLKEEEGRYLIGMVNPQDLLASEEIERVLGKKINLALIREHDLLQILDSLYRHAEEISHYAETLSAEINPNELSIFSETQDFATEDLPVVNLLRSIFEDAAQINASDIHIEPDEKKLYIRLRVDGVLQEQIIEEKSISQALVQRIKLAAGLNIAEKRLPQDGRFTINVKQKKFDVRISTIPVAYGESLVMRLLNQSDALLELNQIGMPKAVYDYFVQILTASHGLLLIVGPTGSGKTTTLYASLNLLNKSEEKIITVEDPVEYRLSRINQVQINPQIGLTFASVLRAILRQDPDIVMIGELRDQETVEIALRASMTGHFVLSTLHTNDTISTATRLLDMGAKGYLIASALRAVLAQRLVRRICTQCIADTTLTDAEIVWLKMFAENIISNKNFKRGKGCSYCHHTGYHGRVGVYELLPITLPLADALREENVVAFREAALKQPLYQSLLHTGLNLVEQGATTVSEVMQMVGEI